MATLYIFPRVSALSRGAARRLYSTQNYDHIIASRPVPGVALLTLNRPKALNALCTPLFKDLNHALLAADAEKDIGAIVITGSEKAFAGGVPQLRLGSQFVHTFRQLARISRN